MDEKQFNKLREDLGNIYFELNFIRKYQNMKPDPTLCVITSILVSLVTALIVLHL